MWHVSPSSSDNGVIYGIKSGAETTASGDLHPPETGAMRLQQARYGRATLDDETHTAPNPMHRE